MGRLVILVGELFDHIMADIHYQYCAHRHADKNHRPIVGVGRWDDGMRCGA
jgi:hypothetical protein